MAQFGTYLGCAVMLTAKSASVIDAAPTYVSSASSRATINESVIYNPDPMHAGARVLPAYVQPLLFFACMSCMLCLVFDLGLCMQASALNFSFGFCRSIPCTYLL